jgi:hypothetical protein
MELGRLISRRFTPITLTIVFIAALGHGRRQPAAASGGSGVSSRMPCTYSIELDPGRSSLERSHEQAVLGAAEKILFEQRLENLHTRQRLQPEQPLHARRRQPEIWRVPVFFADPP